MLKRFLRFLFFLIIIVAAAAGMGLLVGDYIYNSQRFPPNCFLENIDISLLTPREVVLKLRGIDVDKGCSSNIELRFGDKMYIFKPSELGLYIQPVNSTIRAFLLTYERSYLKSLLKKTRKSVTKAPLTLGIEEEKLEKVLKEIAQEIDIPSKEAEFYIKGYGEYVIKNEKIGRSLKIKETIIALEAALKNYKRSVDLVVTPSLPRVFAKNLKAHPPIWLISKFTTRYGHHDDPNRIHNIKLASKKIDNTIITSGEIYSLLQAIGDITMEKGYKEATVIVNGELVPQYGGGVCQIATTLYNAAMLADLDIAKRRNHAIYFSIYPLGRDAMIYAEETDLKIKNSTLYPLLIKSYSTEKGLTFKIFGTKSEKEVSFSKPIIYASGKVIKREGNGIPSEEVFPFNKPFSTKITKYVKRKGKVISTEIIRSYYRSHSE